MKYLIIILVLFSLTACTQEITLSKNLEDIKYANFYEVHQTAYDSGFAGVNNTGEYNYSTSFEVINTNPSDERGFTLIQIKERVSELSFNETPINDGSRICYNHEQWGVSSAKVCFEDNYLVYYEEQFWKGNHQASSLTWELSNPRVLLD